MHWRTVLDSKDGQVLYYPNFIDDPENCLSELLESIAWQTETYTIYGKTVEAPRRVAWYGESDAVYHYSGLRHEPLPWLPLLKTLKERVEQETGYTFNSVLANLYRDGNDSMGWHADKEKSLGVNPVIASISLGEARRFKLRRRKDKQQLELTLESGSLLLMAGALQHNWQHSVPKEKRPMEPRINLTYRLVKSEK